MFLFHLSYILWYNIALFFAKKHKQWHFLSCRANRDTYVPSQAQSTVTYMHVFTLTKLRIVFILSLQRAIKIRIYFLYTYLWNKNFAVFTICFKIAPFSSCSRGKFPHLSCFLSWSLSILTSSEHSRWPRLDSESHGSNILVAHHSCHCPCITCCHPHVPGPANHLCHRQQEGTQAQGNAFPVKMIHL